MKISYVVTECRDKISAQCTKVFNREVKRGRPQVNCAACKAEVKPAASTNPKTAKVAPVAFKAERECPCGAKFTVLPGRGRKASKCDECRSAGTVYRTDDDGTLQAIRAETLAEEQRELREQAGKDRAASLCDMMKPIIERDERRRKALIPA